LWRNPGFWMLWGVAATVPNGKPFVKSKLVIVSFAGSEQKKPHVLYYK
jgi:hypothetical protein